MGLSHYNNRRLIEYIIIITRQPTSIPHVNSFIVFCTGTILVLWCVCVVSTSRLESVSRMCLILLTGEAVIDWIITVAGIWNTAILARPVALIYIHPDSIQYNIA